MIYSTILVAILVYLLSCIFIVFIVQSNEVDELRWDGQLNANQELSNLSQS